MNYYDFTKIYGIWKRILWGYKWRSVTNNIFWEIMGYNPIFPEECWIWSPWQAELQADIYTQLYTHIYIYTYNEFIRCPSPSALPEHRTYAFCQRPQAFHHFVYCPCSGTPTIYSYGGAFYDSGSGFDLDRPLDSGWTDDTQNWQYGFLGFPGYTHIYITHITHTHIYIYVYIIWYVIVYIDIKRYRLYNPIPSPVFLA